MQVIIIYFCLAVALMFGLMAVLAFLAKNGKLDLSQGSGPIISFILIFLFFIVPVTIFFVYSLMNVNAQRRMSRIGSIDIELGGTNWLIFEKVVQRRFKWLWNYNKIYAIVNIKFVDYLNYCLFYGDERGTEDLEAVLDMLCRALDQRELCVHTSRGEFALFLQCVSREQTLARLNGLINEIQAKLGKKVVLHGGVYFAQPKGYYEKADILRLASVNVRQMYTNAEVASMAVKEGGSPAAEFTEEMFNALHWEHTVEESLDEAIANEEFEVYLQPKYGPKDSVLKGAEALIRWNSPKYGFQTPYKFIPVLEKNGSITKIDDYMISHTAKLQAQWLKEGKKIVPVSVNVSRVHFLDDGLAERIRDLVDEYGLPHEYIEIELTESAFFDDKERLLETVLKIKEYGFDVSMDDFGAGYSSLNSLKELPLDVLKIDAGFFRNAGDSTRLDAVITTIITLAKRLNMRVVAEGVEEKDQVDFLAEKGCDMIQGYYFSKPVKAEEYREDMENA